MLGTLSLGVGNVSAELGAAGGGGSGDVEPRSVVQAAREGGSWTLRVGEGGGQLGEPW